MNSSKLENPMWEPMKNSNTQTRLLRRSLLFVHGPWSMFAAGFLLYCRVCLCTSAQDFNIDWHTIDGGGGTSTGGVYSVSGTIGQHDAGGPMTNGIYSLTGGFWTFPTLVQTPGAPLLSIAHTTTNSVVVKWPSPSTGWVLQQNTSDISSVNWSNVTNGIQDDGTTRSILVSPLAGIRFYRLIKP